MKSSFLVIYTFLFFKITTSSNVTCIERERQSLIVFKQTLTHTNNILSTWSGVECCEWEGVGCDSRNGHVVELDLRSSSTVYNVKQLKGELSPSLRTLKYLRYLDLSINRFSGNIPEFLGSFQHLEYLNLSNSGFVGVIPHHLGNLSRLLYLDFKNRFQDNSSYDYSWSSSNFFKFSQAPIVDDLGWVSSLSALRYLDLSGITIGNETDWFHPINMLSSLVVLNLAWSDINIPSVKFANFTSLNSLDLSLNGVNTTFPVWLSNLTELMDLNLHANKINGKIPDFIGNFRSMIRMDLGVNMFSGPIPASLGLLLRLEVLNLYDNQLNGKISTNLGQLAMLKCLDLSYNSFDGVLSETHFTKLKNLNYLALSWNSLELNVSSQWIAPFQLQILYARSCNMIGGHFPKWLQTQTSLHRLDLSNSRIRDTIPEWFEKIVSNTFYLDLSKNLISGTLPRFHFYISTHTRDRILMMNSNKFEGSLATFPSYVKILDLSDNILSGHLPETDGTMNPSLQVVNLSKNRFTGSIPDNLCNVPSIRILDFSQNKFSGRLPECLGNLIKLQGIDLTNNSINGVVPSSLGSLKDLISLHLHNNKFEGNIPMSLENLTELRTMDLGSNLFTGSIPFWIGEKLPNIRFLNLGSNKFSGKIPLQLCKLNALQYLNLAHNYLTGTIPHCFGNLSGMMTPLSDGYFRYIYYVENILASIKGRELLYTKTIYFLTSLDISNNNIVGEIPDSLAYLVGLKSLNLSGNSIKGQIPMIIGDLKQLESLDLSINNLSGRIPQSLTSLSYLSSLNLSFNNLSGPIPVGNQLQTLNDPSIYKGNNGLCGAPFLRSCNGNDAIHIYHVDEDDTEDLWFYTGIGPGFVVGFVGLLGSLHVIRGWRLAYFEMLEYIYGWLRVFILQNFARLKRNTFE